MDNLSLADIAAVTDNDKHEGFGLGGGGFWIFALIVLVLLGNGGGLFGGNAANAVSQADLQRAIDLNSIQNGQREISADIQRTNYEGIAITKDAQYNNLANIRNLQDAVNVGFANQAQCCCETNRNIDSVKFDMANYACAIQQNATANTQKVLDMISTNRMADMQNQINQLQLQSALCGVPKINTFAYGVTPLNWCNSCANAFNSCGSCGC